MRLLNYRYFLLLVNILLGCRQILSAQIATHSIISDTASYPQHYFHSPLTIPLRVISNFGGYRENHFHSGLDLSTGGNQGLSVLASAEGYVSRIKVQSGGYGKAIYITHPNGYITVYAHLNRFSSRIQKRVEEIQYQYKQFEIDYYFQKYELPVSLGEIIALSGNTGNTGGPHLHFEIREEKSEDIINPLLFGFPIHDYSKPIIKSLLIYQEMMLDGITMLNKISSFPLKSEVNGDYTLKPMIYLKEGENYFFGIIAEDKSEGAKFYSSVFKVELWKDNSLIFGSKLLRFGFNQTRSINSFLDYRAFKFQQEKIQISYIQPGNFLDIYDKRPAEKISGLKGDILHFRYIVSDVSGNSAQLKFQINFKKDPNLPSIPSPNKDYIRIPFSKPFHYRGSPIDIFFPKNSLFDDLNLNPIKIDSLKISIGNKKIAIKDSILLSWFFPKNGKFPHYYLVENNKVLETFSEHDSIKTWIKEFGEIQCKLDTMPPYCRLKGMKNGSNIHNNQILSVVMGDQESGLKTYNAFLDNKWRLFEYDAKEHIGFIHLNDNLRVGKHTLTLILTDKVGNKKEEELFLYF